MPPIATAVAARLGPDRLRLMAQFGRFGVVGTIGFIVDTAALYAALAAGAGLYWGRAFSYVVAVTTTWALNRAWTFQGHGRATPAWRQWALFLLVNLVGFASNYGTYAALVATVPLVERFPVLGVAAGSLAGMTGNFLLSRRFVFGERPPAPPNPEGQISKRMGAVASLSPDGLRPSVTPAERTTSCME